MKPRKPESLTISLGDDKYCKFKPECLAPIGSSNVGRIGKGYITMVDKETKKPLVEIPCIFVTFKKKPNILYIYEGFTIDQFHEFERCESPGTHINMVLIPQARCSYKVEI